LCCSMYCLFCVVLYCLCVNVYCTVLYNCHRVSTQLQLTNISYHIFTALESASTPTACCAASTNPWIETIYDNVTHCLTGQNVGDTGRPGQKWWKTDFVPSLILSLWLLLIVGTFKFTVNGFFFVFFFLYVF
jgi:hypothetical protein